MAVTLTDNRIIIDTADTTTGWTGNSPAVVTATFAESTGSVGDTLNIATGDLFFTTAAIDISNSLIYTRSQNQALQGSWTNEVHALFLGDGTDQIAFHEAGNDRETFKHANTEVFFQSFVLDGSFAAAKDAAGETTAIAGSFAALDLTNITEIGSHFITLSKALGGGQNVFVDIIRHDETGHRGMTITGGSGADPGTFTEVAAADESTADQAGHGIIRQYTSGIFGVQGTLRFGANPGQDSDTFFVANNSVVAFEDRDVNDDKFWFYVQGAANQVVFYLQNSTVTSAGPQVTTFFSDAGINELDIQGCTFTNLGRTIEFTDDENATKHNIIGNTFNAVGMIDPGLVKFRDNIISNSADKLGGLLIDAEGTGNIANISFLSDGTGHGFYIHAPGTYSLTNWEYAGFGLDDTEDAAGYNDSNGAVTLNIIGGDTPTIRNGSGSTTTIVPAPVTATFTVLDNDLAALENARVLVEASDGTGDLPFEDSVSIVQAAGTATVTHTTHGMGTGDLVVIRGAIEAGYNLHATITVTGANTYTYSVDAGLSSPATGSPISSGVVVSGLTDSNGEIELTRTWTQPQPIKGIARKSTTPPLFKTGVITGTISNTAGLESTTVLVIDE